MISPFRFLGIALRTPQSNIRSALREAIVNERDSTISYGQNGIGAGWEIDVEGSVYLLVL
ncbi:MAG: hypothetical protein ACREBW_04440 [Candidatus Micrarchaeaceae archaeon]